MSLPINFTLIEAWLAPYKNPIWLKLEDKNGCALQLLVEDFFKLESRLPTPHTGRRLTTSLTDNIIVYFTII